METQNRAEVFSTGIHLGPIVQKVEVLYFEFRARRALSLLPYTETPHCEEAMCSNVSDYENVVESRNARRCSCMLLKEQKAYLAAVWIPNPKRSHGALISMVIWSKVEDDKAANIFGWWRLYSTSFDDLLTVARRRITRLGLRGIPIF